MLSMKIAPPHRQESLEVMNTLPSLEQIQANLPPVESHGSCSTSGSQQFSICVQGKDRAARSDPDRTRIEQSGRASETG